MKKLSEFPLVCAGVVAVILDSCGCETVDVQAEVPEEWLERFGKVEEILGRLGNWTVEDVLPKLRQGFWATFMTDKAVEMVYSGIEDIGKNLLYGIGCPYWEVEMVQELFGEVFEGELRRSFHEDK